MAQMLNKNSLLTGINTAETGLAMHAFMAEIFPLCRSLTGKGATDTLDAVGEHIALERTSVPSGTKVFDWNVPNEWNIRDAYIKNSRGEKIVDFKNSNLHVLNYSVPVHKFISLAELKKHLFTLPQYPTWIPYLTSYYKENWGFCLSHNQYLALPEDTYEVFIDSTLQPGVLPMAEFFIPGKKKQEVLLSTYFCHPSVCNDNLSGVVLLTFLAKYLQQFELDYSYRFLFLPETIGTITWLFKNGEKVLNVQHGLVVTCVGDPGHMTYKKSRLGNALIDKVVEKVLLDSKEPFLIKNFDPCGSDERQFCSPGFNLPMGSLMRTQYGFYPEYHTSADNLNFVQPAYLGDSLKKYLATVFILEHDETLINVNPMCEPQLGKRGLYRLIGSNKDESISEKATLWLLNASDGSNSLLDISMRSGIDFCELRKAADALKVVGLLIPQVGAEHEQTLATQKRASHLTSSGISMS